MKLNLRGMRIEVDSTTVSQRCPGSRLSRLIQKELTDIKELDGDNFRKNLTEREFYLNRNPVIFHNILDFYQSGQLHVPSSICASQILDELSFWEIDPEQLAFCCYKRASEELSDTTSSQKLSEKWSQVLGNDTGGRAASASPVTSSELAVDAKPSRRMRLWQFLDNPRSSPGAMVNPL